MVSGLVDGFHHRYGSEVDVGGFHIEGNTSDARFFRRSLSPTRAFLRRRHMDMRAEWEVVYRTSQINTDARMSVAAFITVECGQAPHDWWSPF